MGKDFRNREEKLKVLKLRGIRKRSKGVNRKEGPAYVQW